VTAPSAPTGKPSELRLRVMSAIVLAVLVLGATWLGGTAFRLLWTTAAAIALNEWLTISGAPRLPGLRWLVWAAFAAVAVVILVPALSAGFGFDRIAWLLLGAVVIVVAIGEWTSDRRLWASAGLAYATAPAIAFAWLRDGAAGAIAILFLFATVWATDIFAFFIGRALKGPKLAPSISPGKTWSGAIGGTICAVAAAALLAVAVKGLAALPILVPALLLSVVSQVGDLAESAFKRRFGVKDSGTIIPGHGGVMDRTDALVVAAVALYLMAQAAGGVLAGFPG